MDVSFLKKPSVLEKRGYGNSQLYREITSGLMTPGIPKGRRKVVWPEYEIDALNRADIAGMSMEERKALVQQLVAQRSQMRPEVGGRTTPRELLYFALLSPSEQTNAIRRLAVTGMSVTTIAAATRLSVEKIERAIVEPKS